MKKSLADLEFPKGSCSLRQKLQFLVDKLGSHFQTVRWRSLDIDYHPPHVERLWTQLDTLRLMIHRIHHTPDTPLSHPHPWPSAVFIISGQYEMGIGYGEEAEPPPMAAKVVLGPGGSYEMLDQNSWHYVNPPPIPTPKTSSISAMLIDAPWAVVHPFYRKERVKLDPLTEHQRMGVIRDLRVGLAALGKDTSGIKELLYPTVGYNP